MARAQRQLTGLRIRALRREAGLTQSALAKSAGISASYLNLIEGNKRAVAGRLLDRIAAGLGVSRDAIEGALELRLAKALDEIAADPALAAGQMPPQASEELVGRHGDWARLIERLYRAFSDERQAVIALADRLNRDTFLGESVHRMLTQVTAIRSAAEILEAGGAMPAERRERFLSIVHDDSRNLAETAQSILAFFDNAETRIRSDTPTEQVDAFIYETGNHFPELEAIAENFLESQASRGDPLQRAETMLSAGIGDLEALRRDWEPSRWRFAVARHTAHILGEEAIEAIIGRHPVLASDEARRLGRAALESYLAASILMPYGRFLESAVTTRYDIDILTRRFGVSYEQAAHRLATLRRPGAEGIRFAFMRADRAGYIDKRLPLPRLPLPRFGSACPVWPVYTAFETPGVTARTFGALPSGESFLFFARAVDKAPPRPGRARRIASIMLACASEDAGATIHGDGIDRVAASEPLGTVCRLCPREGCDHRQEAPLVM